MVVRRSSPMALARWLVALAVVTVGCRGLEGAFSCDVAQACVSGGVQGFCEASGYCSFPDPSCASGRRYGSFASTELATICVGDEPGPDGAPGLDGAPRPDGTAPPLVDASADPCARPEPGPTTTGVPAGTSLSPYVGDLRVDVAGTVVEDLDIDGTITVVADDVTIRRVRLTSGDYYPIRFIDGAHRGLIVEDSEIILDGPDPVGGIAFDNYTARRLNIHGGATGLRVAGNVVVEDSWIHDVAGVGIGSNGGTDVTLRHNKITGNTGAAVQADDYFTGPNDYVVDCSILGGGNYTVQILGTGVGIPHGTMITDNVFVRDAVYGPLDLADPDAEVTGNTYTDGAPITY